MRIPFARNVRLVALAATTALTLTTLSACGGSSDSGSDSKSLEMWTFKQSHVGALRAAAEEFKKETGITVTIEAYTPDDAYTTKVQSSAKTGNLPDVLEVHSDGEDFVLGAAGVTADLQKEIPDSWSGRFQEAIQGSGTVTAAKFKESQAKDSTFKGVEQDQRFSVPLSAGTFGIVYANKQKLADAGITKAPATWEEFLAALKATHHKDPKTGGVSLGLKVKSTGLTWVLQPMAYAQLGKEAYSDLWGKDKAGDFSSANGTKVLSMYDEITPYWMPGSQTLTIDEADQAFAQGKSAFAVGGTFTLAFLQQNGMKADDVLAFGMPAPKDGAIPDRALGPIALTGLSLTATSEQPENAKKWMEFLSGTDVAANFAKESADLPATELGADSATVLGPALTSMMESFQGTPETTYDPSLNDFRPPGYDQDRAGEILADLTPLGKDSPTGTGDKLSKLNSNYWATQ